MNRVTESELQKSRQLVVTAKGPRKKEAPPQTETDQSHRQLACLRGGGVICVLRARLLPSKQSLLAEDNVLQPHRESEPTCRELGAFIMWAQSKGCFSTFSSSLLPLSEDDVGISRSTYRFNVAVNTEQGVVCVQKKTPRAQIVTTKNLSPQSGALYEI